MTGATEGFRDEILHLIHHRLVVLEVVLWSESSVSIDRRLRLRAPGSSSTTTATTSVALRQAAGRCRAAQRLLAGGLLRGPQQHPPLRGRRCWQPAEAARTGWAVAGAVPGPGLMDAGPPAARIARGGT